MKVTREQFSAWVRVRCRGEHTGLERMPSGVEACLDCGSRVNRRPELSGEQPDPFINPFFIGAEP